MLFRRCYAGWFAGGGIHNFQAVAEGHGGIGFAVDDDEVLCHVAKSATVVVGKEVGRAACRRDIDTADAGVVLAPAAFVKNEKVVTTGGHSLRWVDADLCGTETLLAVGVVDVAVAIGGVVAVGGDNDVAVALVDAKAVDAVGGAEIG